MALIFYSNLKVHPYIVEGGKFIVNSHCKTTSLYLAKSSVFIDNSGFFLVKIVGKITKLSGRLEVNNFLIYIFCRTRSLSKVRLR